LFVAVVSGFKPLRAIIAAPKSLEPDDTPFCVRGMIDFSTVWRRADTRAAGDCGGLVSLDMIDKTKSIQKLLTRLLRSWEMELEVIYREGCIESLDVCFMS
jgi:hypothetical protein